jgi:LmbE family N-acetylglucosaminyl deacetylase
VAHPDDETLACGAQLARLRNALIVHVTDGAQRTRADAADCAAVRRRELAAALDLAGIAPSRAVSLGAADQAASFHLVEIARRLNDLLADFSPEIVLTHPYEGGHPDHDATCFAVHAAIPSPASGRGDAAARRRIIEAAFYHADANPTGWQVLDFLPFADRAVCTVAPTPARQAQKQRLLACFESQSGMLAQFPPTHERYRLAPRYDFTRPPHAGQLFYERYDWGVTGSEWRALAAAAQRELAA